MNYMQLSAGIALAIILIAGSVGAQDSLYVTPNDAVGRGIMVPGPVESQSIDPDKIFFVQYPFTLRELYSNEQYWAYDSTSTIYSSRGLLVVGGTVDSTPVVWYWFSPNKTVKWLDQTGRSIGVALTRPPIIGELLPSLNPLANKIWDKTTSIGFESYGPPKRLRSIRREG